MPDINTLAERHLPGDDYTIERREFTDGDTRTLAVHHAGWSATNYITYRLWKGSGELWVEYTEDDIQRDRAIYRYELTDRVI